jgi:hypothetical protein
VGRGRLHDLDVRQLPEGREEVVRPGARRQADVELDLEPIGLVTNDESPWPRIVWTPQFSDAPRDDSVNGFSTSVMIAAATRTRTNAPPISWAKKRRSTAPRTRLRCQPTRRIRGLLKRGARNRCTIAGHGATPRRAREP